MDEINDKLNVHGEMLKRLLSLAGLTESDDSLPDDVSLPISSKEQFQDIERRLANESFQRNMVRLVCLQRSYITEAWSVYLVATYNSFYT